MKVPLGWLADFVDFDDAVVADEFAALGFPVDHIEVPPKITNVVAGIITKLERHPNADRLQICTIDAGLPDTLTIATAATNVAQGQTIPVAKIGAQLPTMKIEPRKMRGIDSEGMLCSAAELGLPDAWFEDGILQLEAGIAPGTDIVRYLALDRAIIDVEITTNRPDALCMLGLARELAAKNGRPLRQPLEANLQTLAPSDRLLHISLQSDDAPEFYALDVRGSGSAVSPIVRRARLAQAGVRPINLLVDLTNYVMLEYGRPMHAYDAEKIGDAELIARDGNNESFAALDGDSYTVAPTQLVITGSAGVLGLAGVIGGSASAVSDATTHALIECAQFSGPRVRRSAAACGIRTEASSRFEKGLAPRTLAAAVARYAGLAQASGCAVFAPVHAGSEPAPSKQIVLQTEQIVRLLGYAPPDATVRSALTGIGCALEPVDAGYLVTPPAWRTDISDAVDLIEEIARIAGYDSIEEAIAPVMPPRISARAYHREGETIAAFTAAGFTETISLAAENAAVRARFVAAGCEAEAASLEIRNPLSEDQRFLRFSLLPAMLDLLVRRANEIRDTPLQFVETGTVFAAGELPSERREILWCRATHAGTTARPWTDEAFLQCKGMTDAALRSLLGTQPTVNAGKMFSAHPGKCAEYSLDGTVVARIGVLDPRVVDAYDLSEFSIVFGHAEYSTLPERRTVTFRPPSRYPNVLRDLALIMNDDVRAADITAAIQRAEPLTTAAGVFDEYRGSALGDKRKSLAVRIALGKPDATLTDDDAEKAVAAILASLKTEFGAELRR